MPEITREEQNAINSLKRLAKRWPSTLWLFSAGGCLCVMACDDNGERVEVPGGGYDQSYYVETIHGIDNDGGDW